MTDTKIFPHWFVETTEQTVIVVLPVVFPVIITESPLAKALATEALVLLVMETLPLEGEAITVMLLGLFMETLVWLKFSVPETQPDEQLPGEICMVGECRPSIDTYNCTGWLLPSKVIFWVELKLPLASVFPKLLLPVKNPELWVWYK